MDLLDFLVTGVILLIVLFVILQPLFVLFKKNEEIKVAPVKPIVSVPVKKKKEPKIQKKPPPFFYNKNEKNTPVASIPATVTSTETPRVQEIFHGFHSLKDAIVINEVIGPPKSLQ